MFIQFPVGSTCIYFDFHRGHDKLLPVICDSLKSVFFFVFIFGFTGEGLILTCFFIFYSVLNRGREIFMNHSMNTSRNQAFDSGGKRFLDYTYGKLKKKDEKGKICG